MGAIGGSLGVPGRNVSLAEMRGFFVLGALYAPMAQNLRFP